MRYAYAFTGLVALAAASDIDVEVLKADTFDSFVTANSLVLAEFYAPWCGHCKALAPEYEEAATKLKEAHDDIKLAKIDCTEETDLCAKYGVEGYPTLKVFRGLDNHVPYNGQRKADSIISYMVKQSLPAVSLLSTSDALDAFKETEKVVVVGYFAADDKASNTTVTDLADKHRDTYPFAAIYDADLAKAAGVKQPAIVVYKKFDERENAFEKKFNAEAIEEFIKTSATPLIGEVGPETYSAYMSANIPLLYIFAEEAKEREDFATEFKDIAEKHKGKVNFATIDAKAFGAHGKNLNIPEDDKWPAIAIQDIANNLKFPFSEQGSVEALSKKAVGKFVDDFVAGKLEPSVKSEPIPENQDGPVTIVVAKNYEQIVLDDKKDVLVEFYAPWCGHCKALAPKYDELGAMFKKNSDKVVIAKVDATANDVPDDISGFPTIKLFPAGAKGDPVTYSGARTVEDLAKFVTENGTHKVEGEAVEEAEDIPTDSLAHQAPAATEAAKGAAEKVVEGAKKVAEAVVGDDGGSHEEL